MTNFKRRDFIKTGVSAGVGSVIFPAAFSRDPNREVVGTPVVQKNKSVVVAGAGIAGLCCGYELMRRGFDVVVLEASGRHGGHVLTAREGLSDGLYADYGAEHITRPGYERYWEYTREFGLEVLPYPRRKNLLRRIDGKFYSVESVALLAA